MHPTHFAKTFSIRGTKRRFPVVEEVESDDDVTAGLLQQPQRWPGVIQQQYRSVKQQSRGPSRLPLSPSSQAPIPLFAPQSHPAARPPILDHHPEPLPGAVSTQTYNAQNFEHDEPAEAPSDHTPKSPTGPLPADYGQSYAQYDNPRFKRGPTQEQLAYQHAHFAYQMGHQPTRTQIDKGQIRLQGSNSVARSQKAWQDLTNLSVPIGHRNHNSWSDWTTKWLAMPCNPAKQRQDLTISDILSKYPLNYHAQCR